MREEDIKRIIFNALEQCDIKQVEFARAIGYTPANISNWKVGRIQMPLQAMIKSLEYLGIEVTIGKRRPRKIHG